MAVVIALRFTLYRLRRTHSVSSSAQRLTSQGSPASLAAAVSSFLLHVQALPWDSQAATCYGTLRAALEASGTPLGNLDTLIAAHALALDASLVTHDKAFRQVPQLKVEDWTLSSTV